MTVDELKGLEMPATAINSYFILALIFQLYYSELPNMNWNMYFLNNYDAIK